MLLAAYAICFAALHLLAAQFGWYYSYPGIDILMHVGGGVFVAWTAYAYRGCVPGYRSLAPWAQALGLIACVGLVGIGWELLEAAADIWRLHAVGMPWGRLPHAFDLPPYNVRFDTLKDLVDDVVGGAIVAAAMLVRR